MAHETRPCGWCYGAGRYAYSEKPTERPTPVVCEDCEGSGKVMVYLYPKPRRSR